MKLTQGAAEKAAGKPSKSECLKTIKTLKVLPFYMSI